MIGQASLAMVYLAIAVFGGLFTIGSLILGQLGDFFGDHLHFDLGDFHFDTDHGLHVDHVLDVDHDLEGGPNPFGLTSIFSWMAVFGFAGYVAVTQYGAGLMASLIWSNLTGLPIGLFVLVVGRKLAAAGLRGHITEEDYRGSVGSATTAISPQSVGEISCTVFGQYKVLSARVREGTIPMGTPIRIVRMEGGVAVVRPLAGNEKEEGQR